MLLTLLGSCGLSSGMGALRSTPVPTEEAIQVDSPAAAETSRMVVAITEAQLDSPHRRPLAMANVLLSGMLFAGGFALGTRRRSAPWFIENALLANMLFIAVAAYFAVRGLEAHRAMLLPAIDAYLRASQPTPTPGFSYGDQSVMVLRVMQVVTAFGAGFGFSLHAVAFVMNRRPAITEYLGESD